MGSDIESKKMVTLTPNKEDIRRVKSETDELDSLIGGDNDDSQEIIYPKNLVDDILKGIDDQHDIELNKDSSLFSSHKKVFERYDPLDTIDREEKQSTEIGYDIDSKFVLTNNQSILNKDKVHNISYLSLDIITTKLFSQYETASASPVNVALGLPR